MLLGGAGRCRRWQDPVMERAPGDRLVLYETRRCPYCLRVRAVLAKLGREVPGRDVAEDPAAREELLRALGRATVPVLRRISIDGTEEWLPESLDIIAYLHGLER